MESVEAWVEGDWYLIFRQGDPRAAENFIRCFGEMKRLLEMVRENPDDFIKHHEKASGWLSDVSIVLNDIG